MKGGASDAQTKCSLTGKDIIWSLLEFYQVSIPALIFGKFWLGAILTHKYNFPAT